MHCTATHAAFDTIVWGKSVSMRLGPFKNIKGTISDSYFTSIGVQSRHILASRPCVSSEDAVWFVQAANAFYNTIKSISALKLAFILHNLDITAC